MSKMTTLTVDELRRVLDYDPKTGIFRWKSKASKFSHARIGGIAGSTQSRGYVQIMLNGKFYVAHRLVWLYVYEEWPLGQVDHINGVRSDNRVENLRLASQSENQGNRRIQYNTKSGYKGVVRHGSGWRASIRKDGVPYRIGTYATPEEAHIAYCEMAKKLHGVFANDGNGII
jgi:hypothetical protein